MNTTVLALATAVASLGLALPAVAATPATATYTAQLQPMNTDVTGAKTTGEARFTVSGNTLTITIDVKGAPPGIVHWQHFHGFKDNRPATCATSAVDKNHDGIIDLIETGAASGTTMVPFDTKPAAMDVAHGHYPKANANGSYHYRETVSLKALRAAFKKAFGTPDLDLDHRVVYIHGVPASAKLPKSVASLGPIPASVTLPIACGKIEAVAR
ncbi:MAG: hypothetical protein ACREFY_10805 [Acetobacteraceae bacterium]